MLANPILPYIDLAEIGLISLYEPTRGQNFVTSLARSAIKRFIIDLNFLKYIYNLKIIFKLAPVIKLY